MLTWTSFWWGLVGFQRILSRRKDNLVLLTCGTLTKFVFKFKKLFWLYIYFVFGFLRQDFALQFRLALNHCIAKADLKLLEILLPQPLECGDHEFLHHRTWLGVSFFQIPVPQIFFQPIWFPR